MQHRHLAITKSSPLSHCSSNIRTMAAVSGCPFFASGHSDIFDPLSLDHWDPFGRCPFIRTLASPVPFYAHVDWKETPYAHVFRVDLPGMKKEEVEVKLEDGRVLHIGGDRKWDEGEKTDKWHRIERSVGGFFRRFRLPGSARASDVKAAMEDGVLTVIVPKEGEEKKLEVKTIEISG